MESYQFLNSIDQKSAAKPKRLFLTTRNTSSDSKELLGKLYTKFTLMLNRLKSSGGEFAPKVIKILNSIVYKYGHAYKHHMFMRRAKHSYSLAKKLSNDSVFPLVKSIASSLSDSKYEYNLTTDAIEHLIAKIFYRILMLDKLRIVCAKNIEFSIGYVERRHNINLNLLFIALAAELGQQALKHIGLLVKSYNELFTFFTTLSEMPVPRLSDLPVQSFKLDEHNAIIEKSTNGQNCDLEGFIAFVNDIDTAEDTLDEFELTKLSEIYEVLRNRPKPLDEKSAKKAEEKQNQSSNFYRQIPLNKGKKKRKR